MVYKTLMCQMTSDKDTFRLIRDNWMVVVTIISLIAGYVTLSNEVGEIRGDVNSNISEIKIVNERYNTLDKQYVRLEEILNRIDRRTEFLDSVNKITIE